MPTLDTDDLLDTAVPAPATPAVYTAGDEDDPVAPTLMDVLRRHVPGVATGIANGAPSNAFADNILKTRDKITKLLANDAPSFESIRRATSEAGIGKRTYGEALNAMRASELAAASSLHKMLLSDKAAEQRERALDIQQQRWQLQHLSRAAASQDKATRETAQASLRAIEVFGGTDPENRAKVFAEMQKDPRQVTAANAYIIAAEAAKRAGIKTTAAPRMRRVFDQNEVVTMEWKDGTWNEVARAPRSAQSTVDRAPQSRRRIEGEEIITEQFEPGAGWVEQSRGPRTVAKPGGITPTQERRNVEIDNARRIIREKGVTPQEIVRRSQPQDAMGRPNPDYDPQLGAAVRLARQRKTGADDPDHESILDMIYGTTISQPKPGTDATGAPAPAPGQPEPVPMTAGGTIDSARLRPGSVYVIQGERGIERWRWTGREFEAVE